MTRPNGRSGHATVGRWQKQDIVEITARSLTFTAGKVKAINRCTAETIDWLAAYETITLRPAPARNSQRVA